MQSINPTFITGNKNKAEYLSKYLNFPIDHIKLDLDEIQSLDLQEIVEHKVKQAFEKIKSPVIVEDTSLELEALHGLPGPFIRFFIDKIPLETICSLINGFGRQATARSIFAYYDGKVLKFFEGSMNGQIAKTPAGGNGYGWDKLFIPEGYSQTSAQLTEEDYQKIYLQIKPLSSLRHFLINRHLV